MPLVLANLEFEEGTQNMGGTSGLIYAIPARDVLEITPPVSGTLTTSTVNFKTGKKCSTIYYTADTGEVKDVEVGEKDCGSFEVNMEAWTPRISDALLTLKSMLANGAYIFFMKDGNGVMRIIGSKDHPAYRTPGEIATGKAPKDKNGALLKFQAASPTPALIYSGDEEALVTPGA